MEFQIQLIREFPEIPLELIFSNIKIKRKYMNIITGIIEKSEF